MKERFPKETEKRISPLKIPRRFYMSNKQITEYEDVDVETLKKGFCSWVDEFLNLYKEPLETEMTDPNTRGRVLKIEDEDSLKYKFVTEFHFSINKVKKEDSDEKDDDFEGMSITYKEKDSGEENE